VAALHVAAGPASARPDASERDRFDTVVLDAGHGGEDQGARGLHGVLEKDLVLDVTRRLAARLRAQGLHVVMTRVDDRTVPLETRTSLANDARGDLFMSIHANSHRTAKPRGIETYFASLEASDEDARKLADLENQAFGEAPPASRGDPLVALLGDLIATEHLVESQHFAGLAQTELVGESGSSRGVKQAPFVVLMGVQMPASLVEIGFISNPEEARALRKESRRDALADSLARAVTAYGHRYDAKRGLEKPRPVESGGVR
jgi:N-acetylmuramoyl-L-alanine amidase